MNVKKLIVFHNYVLSNYHVQALLVYKGKLDHTIYLFEVENIYWVGDEQYENIKWFYLNDDDLKLLEPNIVESIIDL